MNETILLVEDEPSIRTLIRAALTSAGYRIIEARDGKEALTAFDQHGARVDLLITDMRMPRLGGAELIEALHERRQTLKVLCITGYPLNIPNSISEPTLYKPFTREELLQTIRDILE